MLRSWQDEQSGAWLGLDPDSGFGLSNLPYGVFEVGGWARPGVRVGPWVVDISELARAGLLDGTCPDPEWVFAEPGLNRLMAEDPIAWRILRVRLSDLLDGADPRLREDGDLCGRTIHPAESVTMRLPFAPSNVAGFDTCLEHAAVRTAIADPAATQAPAESWFQKPAGSLRHRSTVRASGTPVRHPLPGDELPVSSRAGSRGVLDVEIGLGFVVGGAAPTDGPVTAAVAGRHLFGVVLLNDWTVRDLEKSSAAGSLTRQNRLTSLGAWIVPVEALNPFRVRGPIQEPPAPEFLHTAEPWNLDIALELSIETKAMRDRGLAPQVIGRPSSRRLYWNFAQMLASLTLLGVSVTPGDLLCSGTVSGDAPGTQGCLLELTRDGAEPLQLSGGETRRYLADGDVVRLSGSARRGRYRIDLGEVDGQIVA